MIATDIEDDVFTAVELAQRSFRNGELSAVLFACDRAYIGEDYWSTPEAFAEVVTADLAPTRRGVFVVPIVANNSLVGRGFRPHFGDLDEDEHEEFWILAWDMRSGLDVGRCLIYRDADGTPGFDPIEKYDGQVQLTEDAPGFKLMQALITPTGEVTE